MTLVRRTALATASLALAATLTACTGGEDSGKGAAGSNAQGTETRSVMQVMTAAAEKTSEAKSARISMTMQMPTSQGGTVEMNGVMGWDPYAMDVTMSGGELTATPDAPEKIRMIWLDNAMYMDMGEKAAAGMQDKRWMKLDLGAIAESAKDPKMAEAMTAGLENMNQTPAQQMGLLLGAPDIEFVGEQKLDGVATRHYKGTLTLKQAMEANKSLEWLDEKKRKELVEQIEKSDIKGYDIEAWVNEDDLPVRIDMVMETPEGKMELTQKMSDFGTDVSVQAPPAGETFDLMKMLEELQKGGAGATAGTGSGL